MREVMRCDLPKFRKMLVLKPRNYILLPIDHYTGGATIIRLHSCGVELFTVLFLMYAHLYFDIKNSQASRELNTSTVLPTSCPLGLHVLHSNEGKGLARSQRQQAKPSPVLWFICGYV